MESWCLIQSPVQSLEASTTIQQGFCGRQLLELNKRTNLCCRARSSSADCGSNKTARKKNDSQGAAALCGDKNMSASLRMLKKKQKRNLHSEGVVRSSISKAFSTMVNMLKSMHRFTLEMLLREENAHRQDEVWGVVQKEMHSSFVWLFQQVFARTPKLMVSVMILLANFTAYSMDCSLLSLDQSPVVVSSEITSSIFQVSSSENLLDNVEAVVENGGGSDNKNNKSIRVAGGTDGEGFELNSSFYRKTMLRDDQVSEDLASFKLLRGIIVELEPDNYECFDRTDLVYQHALSLDSGNPLLLANYAQFQYVVRHDHDRAERLFRLARDSDPSDGESMSKFAKFLWLARGDKQGAEEAYKEAIATDPSNPFHVGDYAHFVWHSDDNAA